MLWGEKLHDCLPHSSAVLQLPALEDWMLDEIDFDSNFIFFFQVSIVAMQRGEQLVPFKTRSGDTLEILYLEELSAEVMMVN